MESLKPKTAKTIKAVKTVTSEIPLKVSWFITQNDISESKLQLKDPISVTNSRFGISCCPGKNIEMGRDGKKYARDVRIDVS